MSVRSGLLALLSVADHHGYELKKELEDRTGSLWELNVGQVYTTLSRLERDGLVVEVGSAGGGGSHDQRLYSLTDAGRAEMEDWFARPRRRPSPDRDELVIKLTLAAALDDVDLDEVIDAQRDATTAELQRYTRLKGASDPAELARLFALDAVIAQLDGELRWLEQCRDRHAMSAGARRRSRTHPGPAKRSPARATRLKGSR